VNINYPGEHYSPVNIVQGYIIQALHRWLTTEKYSYRFWGENAWVFYRHPVLLLKKSNVRSVAIFLPETVELELQLEA